jgi:hypothetical protein
MVIAVGCGGGGNGVPGDAKKNALAEIGASADAVYGEGVSTLGKEFTVTGKAADDAVYGILVDGPFTGQQGGMSIGVGNLDMSRFSTARIVFDETGDILQSLYWVDARPDPPPFGKQIPKADAMTLDPAVYTKG